ncbi:STAS-like domain-containing protein [Sphingomonas sp. GlSt437]|uniref:STAS-like domain-containing protein n=1 Tax=Sphingomonas sp. GlSt437 TaxID=3389970 RepID=UPI003A8A852F
MTEIAFSIARDFSRNPGPRLKSQGAASGEALREAIKRNLQNFAGRIVIDLDGTAGFGSSFLDEAFAGLVRKGVLSRADAHRRLAFKSQIDPTYVTEIWEAIDDAPEPRSETS